MASFCGSYVYVINRGGNVFAVGFTSDFEKRAASYPEGSDICFTGVFPEAKIPMAEQDLMDILKARCIRREDLGAEYFEGEFMVIMRAIFEVTKRHDPPPCTLEEEAAGSYAGGREEAGRTVPAFLASVRR
jgi:predicted GIY-YIG superfamily endonuclease